ncbi:unnamed protein product [Blepharisma stoltei]|uniref:CCHC-type domain-containing protein n=1 Tax=Blepharisma stoltei TaxID=1481888 RepID=A0AAU9K8H6_9CILI|nr:unnamed protein product [Blepharisma stoltei]
MDDRKCYQCTHALITPHDCKLKICNSCKLPGHISKFCPWRATSKSTYDGTLCSLCQARGHTPSLCLKRTYPFSSKQFCNLENIRCYVCKQTGHLNCLDEAPHSPLLSESSHGD